ncbi:MAG TPA: hypothetical protein VGH94_10855 [Acidimicrobiales bacterium]|jgi:hypothetical protein
MSDTIGRPQPAPTDWDDAAAAVEMARLIVGGVDDDWLRWTDDRMSCRLASTIVAPEELRRICEERLRRFNEALRVEMAGTGWILSGGWWRRPRPTEVGSLGFG